MLKVLGAVALSGDGVPEAISSRLQRALLAALALERGQMVSADRLADRVWGEHLPANPAGSLQSHVSRLRRVLPDTIEIVTVGDGYRLDVADDDLDAVVFERIFKQSAGMPAPDRVAAIDEALGLWRGTPYSDLDDPGGAADGARLDEIRQCLIEIRAEALLETDRALEAITELEAQRQQHPLRERPVELLMRAYLTVGRKPDSLRVYQELRSRLADELGLDPAPELRDLEAAILTEEVVADRPSPGSEAPPRTPVITLPPSAFLGRSEDMTAVLELLDHHRIVTLVGPGGVGKTRLATHVAHEASSARSQGAWLIELASVRDPEQIPEVVASCLGVRRQREVPLLERIIDHIGERQVLLVLDNCEHLIDAAAVFVDALVRGTRGVMVLATSREALNIDGERVWRLAPLPVDDFDEHDAALQLFAERSAGVALGFELDAVTRPLVADICRRLDGIPLAIELAAARLNTLTLDEVVAGLDERFAVFTRGRRTADERHRSLRAVVDWSVQQLDPYQHETFARLSVFASRFAAAAADDVCGVDGSSGTISDALADLVERSLLVEYRTSGPPTRYGYLDTIRAYAAELLGDGFEADELRDRHAAWAIDLAERMSARLVGDGEIEAARRLLVNLPELRVAHHHLMDRGDVDGLFRLSAAMRNFAILRMHSEVLGWSVAVAERFGDVDHVLTEAVLAAASTASWQAGDNEASRRFARASVEAAARRDEPGAGRFAAESMGDTLLFEGDPSGSLDSFLEAVRLDEEAGDRYALVSNLAGAVMVAGYIGDIDQACRLAGRARATLGPDGGPTLRAWIDYAEGEALAETDSDRAIDLLARALELAEASGARFITGVSGLTHVTLLGRRGDEDALAGVLDLIEHWREGGAWTQQWITMRTVVDLLARHGDHEGTAVVLGAVEASAWSPEVFGADAERLAKARATIESGLGSDAESLLATGAAMADQECVQYATERVRRLTAG